MKLIARPACITGRDHGQRTYVCNTLGWTHDQYAKHSKYLYGEFLSRNRDYLFGQGAISFKGEEKRAQLFEKLEADSVVAAWLDTSTSNAINKMRGKSQVKEVFYYVVHRMAVYKIVSGSKYLDAAPARTSKRKSPESDSMGEVNDVSENESSRELSVRSNSKRQSRNQVARPAHGRRMDLFPASSSPPHNAVALRGFDPTISKIETHPLPKRAAAKRGWTSVNMQENEDNLSQAYSETSSSTGAEQDRLVLVIQDHRSAQAQASEAGTPWSPDTRATPICPSHTPTHQDNPATSLPDITPDQQLTLADTNWRWKVILVHFPSGTKCPFIVRSQPSLRGRNPIFSTDITHGMFMGWVEKCNEARQGLAFSNIVFTDAIFGNRYNLVDEDKFFEALMMHEYDHEFSKKTSMEVYVEE